MRLAIVLMLQAIYHGFRCLPGVHEFVQCRYNAKWDVCRHCGIRVRAV